MKTIVFLGIAFRLIALFFIAILSTYLPEWINKVDPHFLGDYQGTYHYEWGTRHYWLSTLMCSLFLLALANFIIGTIKLINKHYK